MVTITGKKWSEKDDDLKANAMENIDVREGVCVSTDTKPTDWGNGSIILEMDTSKLYVYDADNTLWREL